MDHTAVVGRVCRECGRRFATNDLAAAVCVACLDRWCGIDPGQGRTPEQLDANARCAYAVLVAWVVFGVALATAALMGWL